MSFFNVMHILSLLSLLPHYYTIINLLFRLTSIFFDLKETLYSKIEKNMMHRNKNADSKMFGSATICCAEQKDRSVPNYWRAGSMSLEKNHSTNVVSMIVYCT